MLIWRIDWGVQTEAETVTEQTEAEAKPQQQAKPKKTDGAKGGAKKNNTTKEADSFALPDADPAAAVKK